MIYVTKTDLPEIGKYMEYVQGIWGRGWVTNDGVLLQQLESKLEDYLGVQDLMVVTNGTLALQIALRVWHLGGEVITTPFTFIATKNAIEWEGLIPVYADIDPETYCINPEDVESKITDKTSAIVAVHVYGNPCDIVALERIAKNHGLRLILDAAQAFGVQYRHESVLKRKDISILSFHATKVFNTFEGGAIAPTDEWSAERVRLMRNHGIVNCERFSPQGTNAKMDELRAAVGLCNLADTTSHLVARKNIYYIYKTYLGDEKDIEFQRLTATEYNWAYMPVRFANQSQRDRVHDELLKASISTRKYFYPLVSDDVKCPVAKDVSERILCLPIYPSLEHKWVMKIIKSIKECLK